VSHEVLGPIAELLRSQNLTLEDLAEVMDSAGSSAASTRTVSDFLEPLRTSLTKGTLRGYDTHFKRFEKGMGPLCACDCDECLTAFEQSRACTCSCRACGKSALEWIAAGDRPLRNREFTRSELEVFAELAQRHAHKKAVLDNRRRAHRGQSAKPDHGQGGREMAVAALRCLFERARDDELLERNPAEKLDKGARGEPRRRALEPDQLEEVLTTIVTGGDDPELDLLITWCELELGSRRGGVTSLTVGGLNPHRQTVRLFEKGRREREQPASAVLIAALAEHAARRGGGRCRRDSDTYDPSAPVLYYADSTPQRPHALTSRRFDTLHQRVQRAHPWADEMMYSGHAMRHTLGTVVERMFGSRVAAAVLGHGPKRVTDQYTQARLTERADALSAITGQPHPLASDAGR
jgi:integrase